MPKKQPKNAYFFFMLEFKRHQEAMGKRFPGGMRDVATAASEPWRSVSARDKQRFENMAKAHKEQDKKHGERYTSQGKSLSEVAREEEERKLREENQKKAIVKLIDDAVQEQRLVNTPWYIMSFNYFTKEVAQSKYYPAEIGITRFSIRKGITTKYHCLVNPGKLPLGHAFTAKDHGEKTHKLPVPPKALGESEFDTILMQILEFFTKERTSLRESSFPVFVNDPEMEMCESIMRDFCEKSEMEFDYVKILPLTFFFQKLREAVDKVYQDEESQFTFAIAQAYLERDTYDYHRGNGCQLHEVDDVNPHCALSRATRWAYYIIDQTIGITGGRKRAGYHYPKGCIIDNESDEGSESEEEEKPETTISKTETRDLYNDGLMTDTERFTEISDIKVCKKEFSDDELTTTEVLTRGRRENDTMSTFSSKLEQVRRENNNQKRPAPRYYYETDTTLASRFDNDRSYAKQVNLNTTSRSTNPFHEDNFPSLGESLGRKVLNPLSYRQFDVDSDTSDQSQDRIKHAGTRHQRRRDDR